MSENALGKANSSTDSSDKEFVCSDCEKEYDSQQGLRYHYRNTECSGIECPDCGLSIFKTKRGLHMHRTRQHDYSGSYYPKLADREWFYEQYVINGKTTTEIADIVGCSKSQSRAWLRKHSIDKINSHKSRGNNADNPLGNGEYVCCETCNSEVYRSQSRLERYERYFCSPSCLHTWQSEQTGEDNPLYEGGRVIYGQGWKQARETRLEKDDYECVRCGSAENLEVHHIKPVRGFEDPSEAHYQENLMTLCRTCHPKWEGIPLRIEKHEDR